MVNLSDIGGSNKVVNLGAVATADGIQGLTARWILIVVTGAGTIRFGGDNVSANLGIPLTATNGPQLIPPISQGDNPPPYHLNGVNVYVPAGATVSIAFEPYN